MGGFSPPEGLLGAPSFIKSEVTYSVLSRRRARERALRPRSGPSEVAARWPSVDLELTAARWD